MHPDGRLAQTAGQEGRRFLLHILPRGFVRIRQFGFLANRARGKKLALCRALLGAVPAINGKEVAQPDGKRCPACKIGRLILIGTIPAHHLAVPSPRQDSS
jgi:Putative transposase